MSHTTNKIAVSTDVAKRLDITCRKGDTFKLVMNVKDDAGDDVDFSLYTDVLLQVRPHDEDTSTPVLELILSDYDTSTVGTIIGIKPAATMSTIDAGVYVYDWQFTDATGVVVTWFYGLFKINDDVAF